MSPASRLLSRLFGIYPGEEKQTLLFALIGYFWILAAASGLKFGDALFLIHVGPSELPTVYVFTACGMICFSSFLMYAFHHLKHLRIVEIVILTQSLFYLIMYWVVSMEGLEGQKEFWYLLRVFGYLFFVLVITSFWLFIDQYHHLRDAKRFYCLFSSAIFLGLATTGLLMQSEFVDIQKVLLFGVCLLAVVWYLVHYCDGHFDIIYDETDIEASSEIKEKGAVTHFFQKVLSSPYTLLVMANNFLIELLTWTVEFSYLSYFAEMMAKSGKGEEELLPFLGKLVLTVGTFNLIFALFLFSRLVRRFGVYSLLPVTPLLIILAFSNWLYIDSILFPLVGYGVVEGTIWVIDGNSFNLLLNGVPSALKAKVRVIIEHVFEPAALLSSGILIGWFGVDARLLTLCLACLSLLVALGLRRNYLYALVDQISSKSIQFGTSVADWMTKSGKRQYKKMVQRVSSMLSRGDEEMRLFACECLLKIADEPDLGPLIQAAKDFNPSNKLAWLGLIEANSLDGDPAIIELLHEWTSERDVRLREKVYLLLANHHALYAGEFNRGAESESPLIQAIAMEKSSEELQELLHSNQDDKVVLGLFLLGLQEDFDVVETAIPFIKHPTQEIAREAMQVISQWADRDLLWHAMAITEQLGLRKDPIFQKHALNALEKIGDVSIIKEILLSSTHFRPSVRRRAEAVIAGIGLSGIPVLTAHVVDPKVNYSAKQIAVNVLGRLAPEQLRERLYLIVKEEVKQACFYLYQHKTIEQRYPNESLEALKGALQSSYHTVLDYVFKLLGAAGVLPSCEVLFSCLRSQNARLKSQVVETLEKCCDAQLFNLLQPLVDDIPLSEKMAYCVNHEGADYTLEEVLLKLADSSIITNQIVAATLLHRMDAPYWRETLRKQMMTQEELFHHFAYELLEA